MHILYILSATDSLGGATKSFLNLIDYLKKLGVKLTVVTPDKQGIYSLLIEKGIQVISLRYYVNTFPIHIRSKMVYPIKRIINYLSYLNLKKICNQIKPDIIHSNTSVNDIGFLVAQSLKIPHIWHIREYGDKDFGMIIRHIPKRLTAPLNYSVSITRDIAAHRNVLNVASNSVIYNGIIDNANLTNYEEGNYFLYAGRLELTKGFDDCIRAFMLLNNPNYKLLIAGDSTNSSVEVVKSLKKEISEAGMSDRIEWLGGRTDIINLMQKSFAVIVPSHYEGFGRVMPEAMSVGAIVIGRDTGGTHEQFENGLHITGQEIGLRFSTVKELSMQMKKLISMNNDEKNAIRRRAAKTVSALYSNSSYGQNIFNLYKSILE